MLSPIVDRIIIEHSIKPPLSPRYTELTMDNDRRSGFDRRKQAHISVRLLMGDGSRRVIRRQNDRDQLYLVDQYSPVLFVAIVTILFLCIIDALLTLFLLNHGAYETNPIMAYLLNVAPYAFFLPKYSLTIIATLGLFMFRGVVIRKLNVSTHTLLYVMACVYVLIVAWEFYLLYQVI